MQTVNWRGTRIHIQPHNVPVGSHQLELRRYFADGKGLADHKGRGAGTPVLMVAGFLNTSDVFLAPRGEGGLAPFLASLGYDVYLAELRGRGNSWPAINPQAEWGVHQAICEDLPAHVAMVAKLRPGEAQFWVGQDLGSLLLVATYVRNASLPAPVRGMVHFCASRRLFEDTDRRTPMTYRVWSLATGISSLIRGYAKLPFSDPSPRETRATLAAWKRWHDSAEWLDPVDGFDYGEAACRVPLPPSLYVARAGNDPWCSTAACRRWIEELGQHDGRLITIGKKGGNQRNYSRRELLQDPAACDDHFQQLQEWLEHFQPHAKRAG